MTVRNLLFFVVACVVATGSATATRPRPDAAPRSGVTPAPAPDDAGRSRVAPAPSTPAPTPGVQTGQGSWYGDAHHGRKTASGEVYDKNKLTGAHRTLPFGTRVRVTNMDTGRSVVVRINDRGPFADGRIIDVSEAAAREIGILGTGLARVRIEILDDTASPNTMGRPGP
jgi:rare lipoprotein A